MATYCMCACSHPTHVESWCLRGFSLAHALHKTEHAAVTTKKHTSPGPTRNVHATRRIRVALTALEASGLLACLSTAGFFFFYPVPTVQIPLGQSWQMFEVCRIQWLHSVAAMHRGPRLSL